MEASLSSGDASHSRADVPARGPWSRVLHSCNTPRGVALVVGLVLLLQVKWWWQPSHDGGAYLSIARGMSQGKLAFCGRPHLHYAPGYPAVIAPTFLLSEQPFLAISLVHLGLGLALAAGVYLWFRETAPKVAGWMTIFVMLNASLLHQYRHIHSELLFMTGLLWSVYVVRRILWSTSTKQVALLSAIAGVVLTFTCYTRQVGVFLVPGLGLAGLILAWRGQITWKRAIVPAVAVGAFVGLCVFALVTWDQAMARRAGAMAYGEYFTTDDMTLGSQILEGLRLRISECGRLLYPGMLTADSSTGNWLNLNVLLYIPCAAGVVYGWWQLARRQADPYLWMLPFYAGMYICWPHDQGTRYMLPMLPVIALAGWTLICRIHRRPHAVLGWGLAVHAVASLVFGVVELRESYLLRPQLVQLGEVGTYLDAEMHEVALFKPHGAFRPNAIFSYDTLLPAFKTLENVRDRPRWLIAPALDAPVAGYALRRRYTDVTVWEREPGVPRVAGRN